jgi:hypothetical protein
MHFGTLIFDSTSALSGRIFGDSQKRMMISINFLLSRGQQTFLNNALRDVSAKSFCDR